MEDRATLGRNLGTRRTVSQPGADTCIGRSSIGVRGLLGGRIGSLCLPSFGISMWISTCVVLGTSAEAGMVAEVPCLVCGVGDSGTQDSEVLFCTLGVVEQVEGLDEVGELEEDEEFEGD